MRCSFRPSPTLFSATRSSQSLAAAVLCSACGLPPANPCQRAPSAFPLGTYVVETHQRRVARSHDAQRRTTCHAMPLCLGAGIVSHPPSPSVEATALRSSGLTRRVQPPLGCRPCLGSASWKTLPRAPFFPTLAFLADVL